MDREQIRRDAEWTIEHCGEFVNGEAGEILASHCLALLAELEQAERERDEALGKIDQVTSHREWLLGEVERIGERLAEKG